MVPSEKIGSLPLLSFPFNRGPAFAFLVFFLVTPGLMYIIARVMEQRWLGYAGQYRSFMPGDIGLAVVGAIFVALISQLPARSGMWYQSKWWHVTVLLLWFAVGIAFLYQEAAVGAYTPSQLTSPTKLYHNFVIYGPLGYWLTVAGVPVLAYTTWSAWNLPIKAAALAILLVWGYTALVYDPSNPKPDAHVEGRYKSSFPFWEHTEPLQHK